VLAMTSQSDRTPWLGVLTEFTRARRQQVQGRACSAIAGLPGPESAEPQFPPQS
jgi:hypothetical protein